jgi:DNA-binding transcriptional ArsR family regulator
MAQDMIQAADEASELLKSLSGRSRLVLLCHLWEGEKSVGELARLAGVRETAASQQLALLRKDGIVAARRAGQTIYYSLCSDRATRLLETLHQLFCASPPAPGPAGEMEVRP